MTMKDPEGQTIEYTQYMPGSRHFEDRGKHLGANRVAEVMVGAITLARDPEAVRKFYVEKLGFTEIDHGNPARLRMPGDSGQEVDIVAGPEVKSGIRFGVEDIKHTAEMLTNVASVLIAESSKGPTALTIAGPDDAAIYFVKVGPPEGATRK
jgi:catechol 2,3-dioxygenase-like lactoylglutathione lyase family enzyme